MITELLDKTNLPLLSRHLDYATLRHQVIANNIANVSTPEYMAKDVEFDQVLAEVNNPSKLTITDSNHFPGGNMSDFKISESPDKEIKNGINNVDIDYQMVELSRNQMEFEFSSTMLSRLFRSLKSAIQERVE
jgi:flagellar basal-body rod protein FlgB